MVTPAVSSIWLLKGMDHPKRERECWLFNKTEADFSGLMAESNTAWGRAGWTQFCPPKSNIRKVTL